MKNCKKLIALCLALATVFSFTVFASAAGTDISASGDSASASVNLSSTVDGSLTGDPAATAMSVTVPTVLPHRCRHRRHRDHRHRRQDRQQLLRRGAGRLRHPGSCRRLASHRLRQQVLSGQREGGTATSWASPSPGQRRCQEHHRRQLHQPAAPFRSETGCYMSGEGDAGRNSVSVKYDAIVTPVSKAVTNTGIAAVLFVVEWDI